VNLSLPRTKPFGRTTIRRRGWGPSPSFGLPGGTCRGTGQRGMACPIADQTPTLPGGRVILVRRGSGRQGYAVSSRTTRANPCPMGVVCHCQSKRGRPAAGRPRRPGEAPTRRDRRRAVLAISRRSGPTRHHHPPRTADAPPSCRTRRGRAGPSASSKTATRRSARPTATRRAGTCWSSNCRQVRCGILAEWPVRAAMLGELVTLESSGGRGSATMSWWLTGAIGAMPCGWRHAYGR
jgi:hypothetical protein